MLGADGIASPAGRQPDLFFSVPPCTRPADEERPPGCSRSAPPGDRAVPPVAAAASTSSTGVTGACGANVYPDTQGIDSSPGEKKGFLDS